MTQDRSDIYQRITDRIIAAIEAGVGDWRMPWHSRNGGAPVLPVNAVSGRPYRGVNVVALWAATQAAGYPTGIWATYKQWRECGAQVRKGEQSAPVVFWKPLDDDQEAEEGDEQPGRRFLARGYHVFNAAQVDGYSLPDIAPQPEGERIAHAEEFFAGVGATVRHDGNRAFYSPVGDFIQMPPFAAFCDPVAYYATLAHETVHYTGHPARCARDMKGRFGSDSYAAEELVAELGAAFLCADLALTSEPRPDHAAYVASWLKVLKADSRAIFTAASKAQQAADWLHARQPRTDATGIQERAA